jgi:hypothetical protein
VSARLGGHVRRDDGRHRVCIDVRLRTERYHPLFARQQQRLELLLPGTGYRRPLFMAAIFPEVTALALGDR